MKLLRVLPIFLFIFISHEASAMCEDGFSPDKVLISFAKKQIGEKKIEKELGFQWSQKITQKTKGWNREGASQFLDFLIHRFGEESTLEVLKAFSEFEGTITPHEFINRVTFYDQINKNIVNQILLFHADFDMLMTNSNPSHIRRIHSLTESYIGKEGASHIMWDLLIHEDMLNKARPKEMRKVMWFVEDYTNKHGMITNTPTNRIQFFKERVSSTDRKAPEIQFGRFREFIEFSQTVAERLSKQVKEEEDKIYVGNMDLFFLQFEMYFKVFSLFSAFYHANYHNLKKTINILREYLTPAEIAELLMNEPSIYFVDPKDLQDTISILKNMYVVTEQSHQDMQKTTLTRITNIFFETLFMPHIRKAVEVLRRESQNTKRKGKLSLAKIVSLYYLFYRTLYPEIYELRDSIQNQRKQKKELKEFIGSIIKEHKGILLSADPINLKDTIYLLQQMPENELFPTRSSKENNVTTLQMALLIISVNYSSVERFINILRSYLDRKEISYIITKYFPDMNNIITEKTLNSIEQILKIFDKHTDKQDIFLQRVGELFVLDSQLIPDLHERLTEMVVTSDHNTMKRTLSHSSLSEILSPSPSESSSP